VSVTSAKKLGSLILTEALRLPAMKLENACHCWKKVYRTQIIGNCFWLLSISKVTISFVTPVSVCMKQLGSQWMVFIKFDIGEFF